MKYYNITELNKHLKKTNIPAKKGSVKTVHKFHGKNRLDYFDTIEIDNYWWNYRLERWESDDDVWDDDGYIKSNDYISCQGKNVPKSFKAFNRYVQKLIKEHDFPKGTTIRLTGRFRGVGIFCEVK